MKKRGSINYRMLSKIFFFIFPLATFNISNFSAYLLLMNPITPSGERHDMFLGRKAIVKKRAFLHSQNKCNHI